MATVSIPHASSQVANAVRSWVKLVHSRTGWSSRSSGTATQWLALPDIDAGGVQMDLSENLLLLSSALLCLTSFSLRHGGLLGDRG